MKISDDVTAALATIFVTVTLAVLALIKRLSGRSGSGHTGKSYRDTHETRQKQLVADLTAQRLKLKDDDPVLGLGAYDMRYEIWFGNGARKWQGMDIFYWTEADTKVVPRNDPLLRRPLAKRKKSSPGD